MKQPKCRLCDELHWGLCPTSSRGIPESRREEKPAIGPAAADKPIARSSTKQALRPEQGRGSVSGVRDVGTAVRQSEVAADPREAKFDRNAYQRDYMRKRRARLAAEKSKVSP